MRWRMDRVRRLGVIAGALVVALITARLVVAHERKAAPHLVWKPPAVVPTATATPAPSLGSTPSAGWRQYGPPGERLTQPLQHYSGSATAKSEVIRKLSISQRAVFITIDDGVTRDQRVTDLVKRTHLPVSAFLVESEINVDRGFWKNFAAAGPLVENHTFRHPHMSGLSYDAQKDQICTPERDYTSLFARKPTFFRPPYGDYNDSTLRAVSACGLKKVVLWDATYSNGQLETWGNHGLHPGDIIILHFNPSLYDDLVRLIDLLRSEHLGVGQLESFLAPPPTPSPSPKPTPEPTPKPAGSPTHAPLVTLPAATVTPTRSPTPTPKPSPT